MNLPPPQMAEVMSTIEPGSMGTGGKVCEVSIDCFAGWSGLTFACVAPDGSFRESSINVFDTYEELNNGLHFMSTISDCAQGLMFLYDQWGDIIHSEYIIETTGEITYDSSQLDWYFFIFHINGSGTIKLTVDQTII